MRHAAPQPFRFGTVLLAAGASSRMGRPKMLLPWGATSVLGHLITLWRQLGSEQIAAACASVDPAVQGELDRLGFPAKDRIVNADPARGMFSSIQCAAQWDGWTAGLTHWTIVLGDQPQIPAQTLRKLLAFAADHPRQVCQPARRGSARHPVLLPKEIFRHLAASGAEHLRQFLQAVPAKIALCELEDPSLEIDLDTPADYQRAVAVFLKPPPGGA